jgi:hypothetical protein
LGASAVIATPVGACAVTVARASGSSAVTTTAYGNLRDRWDANEPALSPAAAQSGSFAPLFTKPQAAHARAARARAPRAAVSADQLRALTGRL